MTEGNTFINVDRAIAYGLGERSNDHSGGIIRNNFIYMEPGLFSPSRTTNSDGQIIVWDSPGTKVYHNTILTHGNTNLSIEYRFDTTGGDVRNNLTDARIGSRQGGEFSAGGNILDATADMFVDPENGDLHIKSNATKAIDAVETLLEVPIDIDGQLRPDGPKADAGADERADVNDPPRLVLTNRLKNLAAGSDTSIAIKVADIVVQDDDVGVNVLSLDGVNAGLFEIVGSELRLKQGVELESEANRMLEVIVRVDDESIGETSDDQIGFSLNVIHADAPSLDLDGNDSSGASVTDYVTSYRDGDAGVPITDLDVVINDRNSVVMGELLIRLTNPSVQDILAVAGALPAGITLDPASTNHRIRLVGTASLANYQTVLERVQFKSGEGIDLVDRIIVVDVVDETGLHSATATTTVEISARTPAWLTAPPLPDPTGVVVRVTTAQELDQAVTNLGEDTTILLAPGRYSLISTLWILKQNVTIRGETNDPDDVVLNGRGMENPDFGAVPHGIWCNAPNLKVQNLTIRDVYFHPIQLAGTADNLQVYNVRLIDAGEQFIKVSPLGFGDGADNGVVEYTVMEYTHGPPIQDHGGGTGYTNGVDVHAGRDWVIRNNLFKNFHTPDWTQHLWAPAVLMWNGAAGTITEGNTFINVDRAIAYGLGELERPLRRHHPQQLHLHGARPLQSVTNSQLRRADYRLGLAGNEGVPQYDLDPRKHQPFDRVSF